MKYQAFLQHFISIGGWLEGSRGGWVVVWSVVRMGGMLVKGGGGVLGCVDGGGG